MVFVLHQRTQTTSMNVSGSILRTSWLIVAPFDAAQEPDRLVQIRVTYARNMCPYTYAFVSSTENAQGDMARKTAS